MLWLWTELTLTLDTEWNLLPADFQMESQTKNDKNLKAVSELKVMSLLFAVLAKNILLMQKKESYL